MLIFVLVVAAFTVLAGFTIEYRQRYKDLQAQIKALEDSLGWYKESLRLYREARLADIRYNKEKANLNIKTLSEEKG